METLQSCVDSAQNSESSKGKSILPTCHDRNPLGIMENRAEGDSMTNKIAPRTNVDPYKELELYLAKVNDEIGEIIESVPSTLKRVPTQEETTPNILSHVNEEKLISDIGISNDNVCREKSDVPSKNESLQDWSENILANFNNIIANELNELSRAKKITKIEESKRLYRDLLNDLGILNTITPTGQEIYSDKQKSLIEILKQEDVSPETNHFARLLDSDYSEPKDQIFSERKICDSISESLYSSNNLTSDYDEPSPYIRPESTNKPQLTKQKSSSLPNGFSSCSTLPKNNVERRTNNAPIPKPSTDPMPRSRRMLRALVRLKNERKSSKNKLPPRPFGTRKEAFDSCESINFQDSTKTNNGSQKAHQCIANGIEADYEEVFEPHDYEMIGRSKSLENNMQKPGPPVYTEVRKSPFSKLLRKQKYSSSRKNHPSEAALLRVSSLPNQDMDKPVEKESDKRKGVVFLPVARTFETSKLENDESRSTPRSHVTAKRLAESDVNRIRTSPICIRNFHSDEWRPRACVSCKSGEMESSEVDGNVTVVDVHRTQDGCDAKERRVLDESLNTKSASMPASLHTLLSRLTKGKGSYYPSTLQMNRLTCSEMATQTSPAISRSSSFTWVSDCDYPHQEVRSLQDEIVLNTASPQNTVDDDNRSSSSSQDLLQSMDEISSGSLSPDAIDRASPLESGIGTASPPRSTDCRSAKALTPPKVPYTSAAKQNLHRKETWDQIRRASSNSYLTQHKQEDDGNVWVRRESVHTQTRAEELEYSPERMDSSSGFDDSLPRARVLRPTDLPLGSSPIVSNSISSVELRSSTPATRPLASPSAASLHLKTCVSLPVELVSKSTSAPMLDNNASCPTNISNCQQTCQQPRSQSERQLSEIEAQEACKWLRAAGFPQYAQMYEDFQFPIDVTSVAKDHPFLDNDSLQSLFRRLHALNRCANMKLDTHHHHHTHHNTSHTKSGAGGGGRSGGGEDSDEDAQCALSENWTFEKKTRRWSRVCDIGAANVERLQALAGQQQTSRLDSSLEEPSSTLELDETDDAMLDSLRYSTLPPGMALPTAAPEEQMSPRFRRTGSERLRDGAKAFLRRMESLKSRKRKTQPQPPQNRGDGPVVISRPQVVDSVSMQRKMRDLNCVDVSPTEGVPPITFAELQQLQAGGGGSSHAAGFLVQSSAVAGGIGGHQSPFGDDSSSYCSDGSLGGGSGGGSGGAPSGYSPSPAPSLSKSKMSRARRLLHRGLREDQGALSDSECQPTSWRHRYFKDANSNNAKVLEFVTSSPRESPLRLRSNAVTAIPGRGGSLNLGKESQVFRDKFSSRSHKEDKLSALRREEKLQKSVRRKSGDREQRGADGSPARGASAIGSSAGAASVVIPAATKEVVTVYRSSDKSLHRRRGAIDQQRQGTCSQESSSTTTTPSRDSDPEEDSPRHKGNVVRWHSFQRGSLYPEPLDPLCSRAMASMSCGQLLVLRKLALLKLTACMERYCPTHRTGWNWELPKFIRKIKTPPDYKDKTVFGVPLLLSLQRTGQALPKCIQTALRWLRANALDQVGIFRKSGVRSRIQKLKAMTETQGDSINFDGQQAFDVADLVKQYFRELPEALLTNKLSETFIAIFQHVPADLRPDAVQCALLLLPDEHREALETLLDFLSHVASNSPYNQMTASNLAVCLAPSLFHFSHASSPGGAGSGGSTGSSGAGGGSGGPGGMSSNRSNSVSPRRRKTVGIPDQRELSENKAAHDCLLYLIKAHRELFMVSSDMLTQCHFNYMEESIPVPLEELGSELKQDWRGYMHACTTALLKEGREKSRGWVSVNNPADVSVEMAYKKVGDGHPLRLWRVTTEVEAPPEELLHRVLRERHIWDPQLLKYRQVARLEANAEVFQYATGNMSPLPARDYCVLRSWQSDLPKKACVIVETSVEHPDAAVMLGGTRGIVLASRYLIEHCGSGKSRIMHLSRVDTKGRTPEWYNKSYGHIAALHLSKIRNSFKHMTEGPESKV